MIEELGKKLKMNARARICANGKDLMFSSSGFFWNNTEKLIFICKKWLIEYMSDSALITTNYCLRKWYYIAAFSICSPSKNDCLCSCAASI